MSVAGRGVSKKRACGDSHCEGTRNMEVVRERSRRHEQGASGFVRENRAWEADGTQVRGT